jgi:dTDP-4-dehydrorhamnose reductase
MVVGELPSRIGERRTLLITGGAGYLGSESARLAVELGWDVLATQFERKPPYGCPVPLDLRSQRRVADCILFYSPDAIIHTAYRQLEGELQDSVVMATRNVALAASRAGSRLIHISSDLVFDGEKRGRYVETDEPRPVSRYGEAKLAAERTIAGLCPRSLIVRTSLLYGKPGPQEILALRKDVTFYTDEIRTPLRASDLASALLELAESGHTGVLHIAGPDAVSRYEFARLLAAAQGRDPDEILGGTSPPGNSRARNVALNSAQASRLLRTRIRGVSET